jgi:GDP-L-fucose synthase
LLAPLHKELDLLDQAATNSYIATHRPDAIILAAGKVGGILSNDAFQADFLYENLMIAANSIRAAAENDVQKLLYLGSSCIYPKLAPQPIREEYLLSGTLEPTNEGYALAKIAGLKLCEKYKTQYGKNFISCMPTNLYGPGDNFHPNHSHVIPGMMRRFHEAKKTGAAQVTIWGTGNPKREFMHVDDLASALVMLLERYDDVSTINVGSGEEYSIRELAQIMKRVTGFQGELVFDSSKPDGTPRKILDCSKIQRLGWRPAHTLESGLDQTYRWALDQGIFE